MTEYKFATNCVHAGSLKDPHGSPRTPLYDATAFGFDSTADLLDVIDGRRQGSLYTRYGMNPTIQSTETKLASLEYADSALVFASGMAAESALFLTHGRAGVIVLGDAYGGTLEFLERQLPTLGIPTFLLLGHELDQLDRALSAGSRLVFFETPTNPTLEILDIRQICEISHRRGALVAVDNTFASPVNQQPLALGADLVVHSATKYLGGHDDITAGAVMGPKQLVEPIAAWRKNLGQMLAPSAAHLLSRSLSTLPVRVQRQNTSALQIALRMREQVRVKRVLYPGLPDFPGHKLAASQMHGFGGTVTLEVDGTFDDVRRIVDQLQVFTIAPSLGGVESLVTQPVTTTHHNLREEDRQRRGITDQMIRLSIGLEDVEDLLRDLEQALQQSEVSAACC